MPVKSKAAMRYMGARASGSAKGKGGPSPEVAREMLRKSRGLYRHLPERVSKREPTRRRSGR